MSALFITIPLAILIGWNWDHVEDYLGLKSLGLGSIALLLVVVCLMNLATIIIISILGLNT